MRLLTQVVSNPTARRRSAGQRWVAGLAMAVAAGLADGGDEPRGVLTRDVATIEQSLAELRPMLAEDNEQARYRSALLHVAYASSPNWQLDRPKADVAKHLDDAVSLLTPLEVAGEDSDAMLLLAYVRFQQVMLDRLKAGQLMPEIQRLLKQAAMVDPTNHHAVLIRSMLALAGQPPSEQMLAGLEKVAEGATKRDVESIGWWDMQAFNLLAMCHTFFLGDPETGGEWARRGLELRPDCQQLKEYHEPHTRAYDALCPTWVPELDWQTVASDPSGDGIQRVGGDAMGVEVAHHEGRVWFRVAWKSWPPQDRIGFNLVIDADGDQQTGSPWWGEHKAFRFDRLASLWVRLGSDGRYYGINGTTSDHDATHNRMLGENVGGLSFCVDIASQALIIAMDPALISEAEHAHVIFAVGSNQGWSDDVTGADGLPIRLELRP